MYKYNSILEMFESSAKKFPNKKYIFFNDESYTYSETHKLILHTAATLKANGVNKGDRVVIYMENCPEFIFAYFGIIAIGAIAVPTNHFLKQNEIAFNIKDCDASYIITSQLYSKIMTNIDKRIHNLKRIFTYGSSDFNSLDINTFDPGETILNARLDFNDVAVLIYTSGTTGFPKGVMLTHRNLLANAASFSAFLGTKSKYRFLALLPLFHTYSFMASVIAPLYNGCSVIIVSSVYEISKKSFIKLLLFKRPTIFTAVPQIYSLMSKKPLSFFMRLLNPVKYYVSGGAPLSKEVFEHFKMSYKKPIIEGYGLSEASPIVALNPIEKQKVGSVGVVFPGGQIKIVDENNNELPVGAVGHLCYKGDNVMKGYWNNIQETENVIKNDWLYTGDLAKIDEDGYVYIVGRLKDLIITKGLNVYPREIEELLYLYENVELAAVVGVEDEDGGEIVVACVKCEKGTEVSPSELKSYLKKNLADYKIPKHIFITDNIPVNATGKIMKKELKIEVKKMIK